MGSGQNTGIISGKYIFKVDTSHLFEIGIQKGNLFQWNTMPEVDNKPVFVKVGAISRETGGSEPYTCV